MQIGRTRTMLFIIPVGLLALGVGLWWLLSSPQEEQAVASTIPAEEKHLSAQEIVEDLCASSTLPDHYDYRAVLTDTSDRGVFVQRMEYRKSPTGQHMIFSDEAGNMIGEGMLVHRQNSGGDAATRTTESGEVRDLYLRRLDESGQLGEWETRAWPKPALGSATTRSTESGSSGLGEDPPSFCGLPLELEGHDVEFRFVGNETIDGVETRHYFHSYSQTGDPGYYSTDYWVDSDGRIKKRRTEAYDPSPIAGDTAHTVEWVTTYSGFGETNVITPPSIATATSEPSGPGATSTPTGGDSSATPAATPTPAVVPPSN